MLTDRIRSLTGVRHEPPHSSVYRRIRIRSVRQSIGNVGVVTVCNVIVLSVLFADGLHGRGHWVIFSACVGLLAWTIPLMFRSSCAATLVLDDDELVFRTLVRTVHIPKGEILAVGTGVRSRGLVEMNQPYVKVRGGMVHWLTDFSVPTARKSKRQVAMMSTIRTWLDRPPISTAGR